MGHALAGGAAPELNRLRQRGAAGMFTSKRGLGAGSARLDFEGAGADIARICAAFTNDSLAEPVSDEGLCCGITIGDTMTHIFA